MGLFSSRFRGEEPEDALDRLEADIKRIERDSRRRQQTRTQVTKYSLVIFVIVFVVFIIAYTATVPKMDWTQALLYGLPLIVIPLSFLLLRTAIVHYYRCVLKKNKIMLIEKREEKRKKLEEVRNTSVYTVARNILDRYGGPEDDLDPLIYGDDI